MRRFQVWGRLKIFEESWIELDKTWVSWFPKTLKRLGGKGPKSDFSVVFVIVDFNGFYLLPWSYMKLAMPISDQSHTCKDQMTLEQTLHREGHAVTPMNVQLAMAIRSLASAMVPWLWGSLALFGHNSFHDGRMFHTCCTVTVAQCCMYFLNHILVLSFPNM